MQAQAFQSTAAGPVVGFVTPPPALFRGGRLGVSGAAAVFRGLQMLLPLQGPAAVQGCQGQLRQGPRGVDGVGVGVVGGPEGTGTDAVLVTNLWDKGVAAGRFLEDVLIESGERVSVQTRSGVCLIWH
jgi:hypothetical protein